MHSRLSDSALAFQEGRRKREDTELHVTEVGFDGKVSSVAARQVVLGWGRPSTGNSGERESEGKKEEERIGGKGEMWDRWGERQREEKRETRGRNGNERNSSLVWEGWLRFL